MANILGDKELNVLPTKLHYHLLDDPIWGDCEDETFYKEAKEEISKKRELRDDSDKILKALCYVYRKSSKDNFDDNICNFLYFWLGDILLKKLENKDFFQEFIRDLFKILINKNGKFCTAPYVYMHKGDFEFVKQFFDISEDYKIYKSQLYNNVLCDKNYMTYLDARVKDYKKFHSECEVETYDSHEKRYCKYFKEYFPKDKPNTLSNMKCYLKIIVPEIEQSQEIKLEPTEVYASDASSKQLNAGVITSTEVYPGISRPDLNKIIPEISATSAPTDNPSPSIASKSITGAVSVAGILVPSYLMYNYTYAGTWINKVLGRKTRTNFNPYTDQYLMANFSGLENFNSERSRYNIAYSPE
ncbi:PIR protein [Plasmodium vivax]|nr:PIR protein [Plasmodium vivax]